MTKAIVYTRPDGGISVCYPTISRDDPPSFTLEDALARALAKDIPPDAADVQVVKTADVPADRTFRAAWRQSGGGVGIDMPAARAIHLQRLRAERDKRLDETDKLISRATEQESGDEIVALKAHRRALRDIPPIVAGEIATADTPDALKAVRPVILDQAPIAAGQG